MVTRKRAMKRKSKRNRVYRRKWARKGCAIGDFVGSLVTTSLAHGFQAIETIVHGASSVIVAGLVSVGKQKKERRMSAKTNNNGILDVDGIAINIKRRKPDRVPVVRFSDVVGLGETKGEILLRTVLPLRFPDRAEAYKLKTGGGILLWGPPGCGKTLLAKAVAGELEADFLHVRASDLISGKIGQSEKNVALLFGEFRSRKRAVLFIDEIDSLVPSRRKNRSTIMARVISEFLSQLDGVDSNPCRSPHGGFSLIVAATNWIEAMDEAILRPGRFDVLTFVGLPEREARSEILEKALAGRLVEPGLDVDTVAKRAEGFSGADIWNLVETASRQKFLESLQDSGEAEPILLCLADLDEALEAARPSVTPEERLRYEQAHAQVQESTAFSGLWHSPRPKRRTGSTESKGPDRDREPSEAPQAKTPCSPSEHENSRLETAPEDEDAFEEVPVNTALVAE